jgi:hypothetical protein
MMNVRPGDTVTINVKSDYVDNLEPVHINIMDESATPIIKERQRTEMLLTTMRQVATLARIANRGDMADVIEREIKKALEGIKPDQEQERRQWKELERRESEEDDPGQ